MNNGPCSNVLLHSITTASDKMRECIHSDIVLHHKSNLIVNFVDYSCVNERIQLSLEMIYLIISRY